VPFSSPDPLEQIVYETVLARDEIINLVASEDRLKAITQRMNNYIDTIKGKAVEPELIDLLVISIEHYVF
jgi:hypothetical protein